MLTIDDSSPCSFFQRSVIPTQTVSFFFRCVPEYMEEGDFQINEMHFLGNKYPTYTICAAWDRMVVVRHKNITFQVASRRVHWGSLSEILAPTPWSGPCRHQLLASGNLRALRRKYCPTCSRKIYCRRQISYRNTRICLDIFITQIYCMRIVQVPRTVAFFPLIFLSR